MFQPLPLHATPFSAAQALQEHQVARQNYASDLSVNRQLPHPPDMATVASVRPSSIAETLYRVFPATNCSASARGDTNRSRAFRPRSQGKHF